MKAKKMTCQECGVEMNRHATKVIEPRSREEMQEANQSLGGIVEHVHACPGCGKVASQR